jgi:curli production assembly/transport component CsgG
LKIATLVITGWGHMEQFNHKGALKRVAALAIMGIVAVGCQSTPPEGLLQPVVSPVTTQSHSLRTVPAPRARIPVAVYDFPDLTGQYKERDNVQSLSRAVTQGGAPMLIKALQDAGERRWFSVLDRARLDDILKERQIVTEMRRLYRGEQQTPASVLAPLAHAGIIIQGGITGYDTNTMTGGLGARYLGIGGDAKWQQDTVTVTLRAVSTDTGEVLASVSTHKMIASQSLQGGVFRYVALDRILEAEAGVTQNEPRQIAVQQAIEKAVVSLIIEGAELGVWHFANPAEGQEAIAAYREEKYGQKITIAARTPQPPATPNAAQVVETVPAAQTASVVRRAAPRAAAPAAAAPQPAQPQTPPPGADDEVVGSVTPAVAPEPQAQATSATPPPPAADEVVGSIRTERGSDAPAMAAPAGSPQEQVVASVEAPHRFSRANEPLPGFAYGD